MSSSLVDVSSFHAVESLFRGQNRDPWAAKLAGDLADIAIYSDKVHYPLPGCSSTNGLKTGPDLVLQFVGRDSNVFTPKLYSTNDPRTVADDHLESSLSHFAAWCRANPSKIQRWLAMHKESWIASWHSEHIPHKYVFDVKKLGERNDVQQIAVSAGLTVEGFLYALDVVLRYPMYGEMAGEGCSYLNHPIRDAICHPTLKIEGEAKPMGAVTFARTIASIAPSLTQDEYTSLVHELRSEVRNMGIHRLKPGQIEREVIRELAARIALPPKLAFMIKNGSGDTATLGLIDFAAGIPVSIALSFWGGSLPRPLARVKWLRWAMKWEIEAQAKE